MSTQHEQIAKTETEKAAKGQCADGDIVRSKVDNRDMSYSLQRIQSVVPAALRCHRLLSIQSKRFSSNSSQRDRLPVTSKQERRSASVNYTQLYNALVKEPIPTSLSNSVVLNSDGKPLPQNDQLHFKSRLEDARKQQCSVSAISILEDIKSSNVQPTAKTILSAMDVCVSSGDFSAATAVLSRLESLPATNPTKSRRLVIVARRKLAIAYSLRKDFHNALRIMGIPEHEHQSGIDEIQLLIIQMKIGSDALAWGVMVKSFTKLRRPEISIALVDMATKAGVPMSDSFLHLTIDSLRMLNRWQEAHQLFQSSLLRGIKPSEMTLASMLLAYASRSARADVKREYVEQVVDLPEAPTPRFLSAALTALSAVGSIARAEDCMRQLEYHSENGKSGELTYHTLMGCYGYYLERLNPEELSEMTSSSYIGIGKTIDKLWEKYLKNYGDQGVFVGSINPATFLGKYLHVKTRCFQIVECIEMLESISDDAKMCKNFDIDIAHISTVLGSVEHSCDVKQMQRLLHLMERHNLTHDMRSLAFTVGTLVGDGSLKQALELARKEVPLVVGAADRKMNRRRHFPILLERRLLALRQGLSDGDSGGIEEVDCLIGSVKSERARYVDRY